MRETVQNEFMELVAPVMPYESRECQNPDCNHYNCHQDKETGTWYKDGEFPVAPTEDELPIALQAAQVKELRSIRKMLTFFTVLAVASIALSILVEFIK